MFDWDTPHLKRAHLVGCPVCVQVFFIIIIKTKQLNSSMERISLMYITIKKTCIYTWMCLFFLSNNFTWIFSTFGDVYCICHIQIQMKALVIIKVYSSERKRQNAASCHLLQRNYQVLMWFDSLVTVTVENLACSSLVIKLRGGFIPRMSI